MTRLFRKILVPHDLSTDANQALALAATLAAEHRGRLLVLYAIAPFESAVAAPPVDAAYVLPTQEMVAAAQGQLAKLVARTVRGRRRPPVECRVVIGNAVACIVDAARKADTIVMATAGRSGLAHLVLGSTAERVVRAAPVPVLTVRPRRARRRAATGRGRRRTARRR